MHHIGTLDFFGTLLGSLAVSAVVFFVLVPVTLLIDGLVPNTRRDIERDILGSYVFLALAANILIALLAAADSSLLDHLRGAGLMIALLGGGVMLFGGGFAVGMLCARQRARPRDPAHSRDPAPPHIPKPKRDAPPKPLGDLVAPPRSDDDPAP
jgi:hypothetical protein